LYFFKSTPRNNEPAGSLLAEQRHEFIQSSSRIDRLYKRNQTIGLEKIDREIRSRALALVTILAKEGVDGIRSEDRGHNCC